MSFATHQNGAEFRKRKTPLTGSISDITWSESLNAFVVIYRQFENLNRELTQPAVAKRGIFTIRVSDMRLDHVKAFWPEDETLSILQCIDGNIVAVTRKLVNGSRFQNEFHYSAHRYDPKTGDTETTPIAKARSCNAFIGNSNRLILPLMDVPWQPNKTISPSYFEINFDKPCQKLTLPKTSEVVTLDTIGALVAKSLSSDDAEYVKQIFKSHDRNQDQLLSLEEIRSLPAALARKLKDRDGDRSVSPNEVISGLFPDVFSQNRMELIEVSPDGQYLTFLESNKNKYWFRIDRVVAGKLENVLRKKSRARSVDTVSISFHPNNDVLTWQDFDRIEFVNLKRVDGDESDYWSRNQSIWSTNEGWLHGRSDGLYVLDAMGKTRHWLFPITDSANRIRYASINSNGDLREGFDSGSHVVTVSLEGKKFITRSVTDFEAKHGVRFKRHSLSEILK